MKYAMPGRDLPKVMANPTAQYTMAPMHMSSQFLIRMFTVFLDLEGKGKCGIIICKSCSGLFLNFEVPGVLPDCARLHECESALHEEDDDGHDEQEEVVNLLRLRTLVLK